MPKKLKNVNAQSPVAAEMISETANKHQIKNNRSFSAHTIHRTNSLVFKIKFNTLQLKVSGRSSCNVMSRNITKKNRTYHISFQLTLTLFLLTFFGTPFDDVTCLIVLGSLLQVLFS